MNRARWITAVVLLASFALAGAAQAKPGFNPQIGITGTNLVSAPSDITKDEVRAGWMLGCGVSFGKSLIKLVPGVYYQRTALEATTLDQLSATTISDVVGVNSWYLPLKVDVAIQPLGMHAFAGPALTVVSSVASNDLGIEKSDYNDTHSGLEIGAGFALGIISVDFSYEKGLSNVFKDVNGQSVDGKNDVYRLMGGIKL